MQSTYINVEGKSRIEEADMAKHEFGIIDQLCYHLYKLLHLSETIIL